MRTNSVGLPGRYRCDHCGKKALRGVYTGKPGFEHVCFDCKNALESPSRKAQPPGLAACRLRTAQTTMPEAGGHKAD